MFNLVFVLFDVVAVDVVEGVAETDVEAVATHDFFGCGGLLHIGCVVVGGGDDLLARGEDDAIGATKNDIVG